MKSAKDCSRSSRKPHLGFLLFILASQLLFFRRKPAIIKFSLGWLKTLDDFSLFG